MARTSTKERPLSPHLQIYRLTITMVMSIIHRITGVALFFGTILLIAMLLALVSGEAAYLQVKAIYGSYLGKLVLFGYTWALFHHLCGGLRHLVWDTGAGFDRKTRFAFGWLTLLASISLTLLTWVLFYFS